MLRQNHNVTVGTNEAQPKSFRKADIFSCLKINMRLSASPFKKVV